MPVSFEVNQGQTNDAVLFLGRARDQTVYVTADDTALIVAATGSYSATGSGDSSSSLSALLIDYKS